MSLYLFSVPLLVGEKDSYSTQDYLEYTLALDKNESLKSLVQKRWDSSENSFNTLENMDKAYWIKLDIKNSNTQSKKYYLQVENQPIYHIEFFLEKEKGGLTYHEDGAIVKSPKRIFNNTHIMFPLELEMNEKVTLFIKIKNFNKNKINFLLINEQYLLTHEPLYNFLEALFFGGMLILIFYNFLMYLFLRLRIYLYYVLYTFWVSIYFLGFFGYINAYFPELIFFYHISSGGALIALTLFIQALFRLKEKLPIIYKLLHLFNIYFLLSRFVYIYFLEIDNYLYAQLLFDSFFLVLIVYSIIIILVTQYLAYEQDYIIAKMYGVVWIVAVFSVWLLSFISLNIIKVDTPINYYIQLVVLFEALSFSYLLVYKIKVMEREQKERDKIQVRQNKLASISEIIALIAHQWRQPLAVINSIVLALTSSNKQQNLDTDRLEDGLSQIEKSTFYLSNTIQDFMYLFSKEKPIESFKILDVINESKQIALLSHTQDISIVVHAQKNIELLSYKSELVQALIIVFNNAIYAVLKKATLSPSIKIDIAFNKSQLTLLIEDNGGGIDEAILENIFDPYFTTKDKNEGTGLGLYILKIIIEESMQGKVMLTNGEEGVVCKIQIPIDIRKLD